MAKLVIKDENNNIIKAIRMGEDSNPDQVSTDVPLYAIDYMTSRYSSLDRFKEVAMARSVISDNVTRLEVIDDSESYEPVFNNNLIHNCAKSAYENNGKIIDEVIKNNPEFSEVINEFIRNIETQVGIELANTKFADSPAFLITLNKYNLLSKKDGNDMNLDEVVTFNEIKVLNDDFEADMSLPEETVDDYFKTYSYFKKIISFNAEYLTKRNDALYEVEKEEPEKIVNISDSTDDKKEVSKKIYGQKLTKFVKPEIKEQPIVEGTDFVEQELPKKELPQRSLCLVIGSKIEPLKLVTGSAKKLDDYITTNFSGTNQVRKTFEDKIVKYINLNINYLNEIRDKSGKKNYAGQVVILEHNPDGSFKRDDEGIFARRSVIYRGIWGKIKVLSINVDKMKEIARYDYNRQKEHPDDRRIFTPCLNKKITFGKPVKGKFPRGMGVELKNWVKELKESEYGYDDIRTIRKFLRTKKDYSLETKESKSSVSKKIEQMESIKEVVQSLPQIVETSEDYDKEDLLEQKEYEEAYGEEQPLYFNGPKPN